MHVAALPKEHDAEKLTIRQTQKKLTTPSSLPAAGHRQNLTISFWELLLSGSQSAPAKVYCWVWVVLTRMLCKSSQGCALCTTQHGVLELVCNCPLDELALR